MTVVERSIGRFYVSSSKPGKWYLVKHWGEEWTCNCDSGIFGKDCRHVSEVKAGKNFR